MPIFVYEPVFAEGAAADAQERQCCFFETLQWSNEAVLTQCPECGGEIRRAVTSFALAAQAPADPLKGVAKKLGDGLSAAQGSASSEEKAQGRQLISGSSADTPAGRAARMAYRHVCSGNCRH